MTTTKQKALDLHANCMKVARAEIERHIQIEEGEKRFNLYTFLPAMEAKLDELFGGKLNADAVARYLYSCLALEHGDSPSGAWFHGMPVLD